jgi:hypothetical protein
MDSRSIIFGGEANGPKVHRCGYVIGAIDGQRLIKILQKNCRKFIYIFMKDLNLNPVQLQAMDLIDTILNVTAEMGETPADMITPGQAKEWMNKLSSYLCRLGTLEAEFESYFYRIMANERDEAKSNADAEMRAKTSSEYLVYRKIKNFRQDLYEKIQSAKRLITDDPDQRKDDRRPER